MADYSDGYYETRPGNSAGSGSLPRSVGTPPPLGGPLNGDADGAGATHAVIPGQKMLPYMSQLHTGDVRLLMQKHQDYGPLNISRAPGGPLNGLRVRLWDKFARLNHLAETGAEPQNESVRDTLRDMRNYLTIYEMVLDGVWPE